jgi:c-di-GMP-binding flagellar brake protein YcgR
MSSSRSVQIALASLLLILSFATANATDLTLTTGGRVTIELVSSDAAFSNTLSVVTAITRADRLEDSQ